MRVFLSGDTRSDWQGNVISRFPEHEFFDPRTLSERTLTEMAETERGWLDQSDVVLAYLNVSNPYGFGTSFEIGYAVARRKLVIYVDEKQVSSSQWIAEHPVHPFATIEEGISKLAEVLEQGNGFVASHIADRLRDHDFTGLVYRELDDDLAARVAALIYNETDLYSQLLLASQVLPRQWYDWNVGYLLHRLNPQTVAENLARYSETLYRSEGVAWALGVGGSDDPRITSFLQQQCIRCEDYDAWWCAAHSLEQLGHGNAIDILKRTLVQDEWQQLDHCLANIGTRPATIGILRLVTSGNIDSIVEACLSGLNELVGRRLHNVVWLLERLRCHDRKVIDALMRLHSDRITHGSSVAHRVVEAFGQIAHPSTRSLLEKHLREAKYFRTRAWAAKGLGLIGEPESVKPLREALTQETNPHVVSHVSEAIYAIVDPDKRQDAELIRKAQWLENGMIADDSNKWYWSPAVYDQFSRAEDPQSIAFNLAISLLPEDAVDAVDLGSGTGRFIREIRNASTNIERITAVDASPEMVTYLKRQFSRGSPAVRVAQATLLDLPMPDESVDVVVSSWGFPSRIWDREQSMRELAEVHRVLRATGVFVTIGWDEEFNDEMTEVWYRFVMEREFYFETLADYRRRKRSRIRSTRNCTLTAVKTGVSVPVMFNDRRQAADVFGHLFGYEAGVWVLNNDRREFQMGVSITRDSKADVRRALDASGSRD